MLALIENEPISRNKDNNCNGIMDELAYHRSCDGQNIRILNMFVK